MQKRDEHVLLEPFAEDFAGCEEPDIYEILEYARPYLPREGAFGEMVLNVGQGGVSGEKRRGRNHRHQPIYLHERNRVRSHLSAVEPGLGRASRSATSTSTARKGISIAT